MNGLASIFQMFPTEVVENSITNKCIYVIKRKKKEKEKLFTVFNKDMVDDGNLKKKLLTYIFCDD